MSNTGPISVEALLLNARVVLGEPVILQCRINNTAATTVRVHMGEDNAEWLAITMADAEGQSLPVVDASRPRRSRPHGVHLFGARISPGGYYQRYIIVSRRFGIPHPGIYHLSINARLPYGMEPEADNIYPGYLEQTFGTVFTWRQSLPLTVDTASLERLRERAEELREAAAQRRGSAHRRMLLTALFSMPEEAALNSWRAVASDPRLVHHRGEITSRLESLSSTAAADILADISMPLPQEPQ